MAAASIIIDLLMKTGSFETDTQRAGRALSKLSKDAKSSANQIANEFKRVQEAIQKAGMTANQQKIFELKGLGATQQQLVAYSRNLDELDRKTKTLATSNQTLATSFKAFAGTVGVGIAFSQISQAADSYTKLSAQLRNATQGAEQFNQAYSNVQRIASSSQSDIESVATVYARLGNATKDLGVSQDELSDIVETLSLSLKLNGATSAEASSTLLQLSQAFGKGKLDGDEFRTAMEAAPNVMRALAKSMGVPFGALKDLAKQGEITSEVMIKAFSDPKLLESIREQAKDIRTIGGGYTEIANQLKLLVGEENNAIGVTSLFAKALGLIADSIERIRRSGGVDIGLANFVPGGGAIAIARQASDLARRDTSGQTSSGQIKFNPAAPAALGFDELSNGLNIASIKIKELVKTQEEAVRSLNSGKITYDQYKEIIAATGKELTDLTDKTKKKTKATKEDNSAIQEFAKQQQEIANLLTKASALGASALSPAESLQAELDAYSQLNPAIRDYVQGKILAAKASQQFAEMEELLADAHDRELDALIESQEEQVKFEGDIKEYIDSVQRAIDPTIELADNIGKLQSAFSLGLIDQDTYDKLAKFVEENDKSANEITDFWRKAAENMQDAMSDFFFDIMQGNLSDLASSFKATIDRMVANVLAAKAATKLFGDDFLTGKSDSLGGLAGDFFKGAGSFFGDLLPSFDVGTPYVQQDMVAKIHKGERILTAQENREFSSGQIGGTVVMNINTPNADSFRKSQAQIMADMQRGLNRGRRVM